VEEPWKAGGPEGITFPIPVITATFNPRSHPGAEAPVVTADFVAECKSDDYESCAENCWNRTGSPFTVGPY